MISKLQSIRNTAVANTRRRQITMTIIDATQPYQDDPGSVLTIEEESEEKPQERFSKIQSPLKS